MGTKAAKRQPSRQGSVKQQAAVMVTSRDGLIKAAAGVTTLAEVFRATQDTDEGAE